MLETIKELISDFFAWGAAIAVLLALFSLCLIPIFGAVLLLKMVIG